MISNEVLSAYIDGELPPEETERVRTALAEDELLAARLRQLGNVDRLLVEFSSGIDGRPLPQGVLALLEQPIAEPATAGGGGAVVEFPRPHRRWQTGFLALAASVVLAVAVGVQLELRDRGVADFDRLARTGAVDASGPLHRALEQLPSDETWAVATDDHLAITPVLSFVSTGQQYCREFRVDADERAARGVACRRDDHWETLRVTAVAAGDAGAENYETATGSSDAGFDAFVDSLAADAPLDADSESQLLRNGWRQ